jgi:hypothetical protein
MVDHEELLWQNHAIDLGNLLELGIFTDIY